MTDDERSYASLADELNDHPDSYLGGKPTIDDFDDDVVVGAKRFATANNFSWPPQTGDFDRYYEWKTNQR